MKHIDRDMPKKDAFQVADMLLEGFGKKIQTKAEDKENNVKKAIAEMTSKTMPLSDGRELPVERGKSFEMNAFFSFFWPIFRIDPYKYKWDFDKHENVAIDTTGEGWTVDRLYSRTGAFDEKYEFKIPVKQYENETFQKGNIFPQTCLWPKSNTEGTSMDDWNWLKDKENPNFGKVVIKAGEGSTACFCFMRMKKCWRIIYEYSEPKYREKWDRRSQKLIRVPMGLSWKKAKVIDFNVTSKDSIEILKCYFE